MKITCQACQSKYTIADDKIQGKVAKIRCRKCGATVLVDASAGGGSNGASGDTWMVSVAEGDQRTMQLQEVIDAYNSGVITGDTYLWKDGMGDWLPLSEVAEIVEALNAASGEAAAPAAHEDYSAPAPEYNPPAAFSPPAPAAARRETGRGRGDLFGGSAAEEEVATSAPVHAAPRGASAGFGGGGGSGAGAAQTSTSSGLTGGRNEQSVLFSLSALTGPKAAAPVAPSSSSSSYGANKNDDSGVIDLGALAKAQAAKPAEAAPVALAAPSPFLFPAALGNVETFQTPDQQQKKSSMPLIVGGGVVVVLLAVALFVFTGKKEEIPPLPAGAALSAAASVAAPEPPPPVASAEPAPADSAPVASTKGGKKGGGGAARPKPAGGGAAAPATPLPPPKPKSPCGCSAGDLQCQIRCSATGH